MLEPSLHFRPSHHSYRLSSPQTEQLASAEHSSVVTSFDSSSSSASHHSSCFHYLHHYWLEERGYVVLESGELIVVPGLGFEPVVADCP